MAKYRQGRLNEEIKKSISNFLVNGIKDPRLSSRIITVSAVEVTRDMSYATIFVTPLVLSEEDRDKVCKEVLDSFNGAKSAFRGQIGRDVKMRKVPELIFKIDSSMEYGRHIDSIIDTLEYHNDDLNDDDGADEL